METWFIICISLCISALLIAIFNLLFPTHNLPPGPSTIPIIGNILWMRKSSFELESILRTLHTKLGPIVTLRIGYSPAIFISDRSLAYKALVQNGALFANRPPALATTKITASNQHTVSGAFYGSRWRCLRRNLIAEILHPSRVKSYTHARKWVLQILINRLKSQSTSDDPVIVVDNFQYAMFCLLVLMCFGDKLDENQIKDIENVQSSMLVNLSKFNILNFWPRVTKILFRKKWEKFFQLSKNQEDVLIPLIRERRKRVKEEKLNKAKDSHDGDKDKYVLSYIDTLFDLQLPEENRKLDEVEMVSLCSEFLNAGLILLQQLCNGLWQIW